MLKLVMRLLPTGCMSLLCVGYFPNRTIAELPASVAGTATLTNDLNPANPPPTMNTLPSVAELSDVKPTDWAYQALQTLVDRYGIIVGYPDRQFRGNQPMSRFEFVAALNATITYVTQLLDSELAQYATQEDLELLKQLQEQFAKDLAAAKSELPAAEITQNLDQIRNRAFSATTKLGGEAIFATSLIGSGEKVDGSNQPIDRNITLGNRIKLSFDTSFTGKDRLTTALKTGNLPGIDDATGTDMARSGFQGDRGNQFELDELSYRFPLGDRARVRLIAVGGSLTDFARSLNPLLDDTGTGALSRFGQRNPIYRQGGGSGVGITYRFNDVVTLGLGYLTREANNPTIGLNQSPSSAIVQLTISPTDAVDFALTYVRSYNNINTRTGSAIANDPFLERSNAVIGNSVGFQSQVALSNQMLLSGWLGWTQATAKDLPDNPSASLINWAITLAIADLGRTGNLLGIVFGQPPKTIRNQFTVRQKSYVDTDTSLHLETFYQWRVVDNFNLTLGLVVVLNPEHDRTNDTIYIGTLRSTFTF